MRYLLAISYDGSAYYGFQRQNNLPTIQGEIEKALKILLQEEITITPSGRTDAKVHALNQIAHFDTAKNIEDLDKFKTSMNALLAQDILIKNVQSVTEDFHARFNAKQKTYLYKILLSKQKDPFKKNYYHICGYDLDLAKMQQACNSFLGTHDFTSFSVHNPQIKNTIRTISDIHLKIEENEVFVYITGDGFLHNMVRCIVGTLIDVARGRFEIEDIGRIFSEKNHQKAGKTLEGSGLYLVDVKYSNS